MKNISVKCLGKKRKFDESLEKISTLESKINNKRKTNNGFFWRKEIIRNILNSQGGISWLSRLS